MLAFSFAAAPWVGGRPRESVLLHRGPARQPAGVCSSRSPTTFSASLSDTASKKVAPVSSNDVNFSPSELSSASATPERPPISGTLFACVAANPAHLGDSVPLAHSRDGDGYILAVSLSQDPAPPSSEDDGRPTTPEEDFGVWVRGRFVRTRAFLRESKAGKRVYRGRYGTPAEVKGGLLSSAPRRPKPACSGGVFIWGGLDVTDKNAKRRLIAYGDGSLPLSVDMVTLATRGPTGLGAVLTDVPELEAVRGAEVVAQPVEVASRGTVAICTRMKTSTGRITGLLVTEVSRNDASDVRSTQRVPLQAGQQVASFTATDSHYFFCMQQTGEGSQGALQALGSMFASKAEGSPGPSLDSEFGTMLIASPFLNSPPAQDVSVPPQAPVVPLAQLKNTFVTACCRAAETEASSSSVTAVRLDLVVRDSTGIAVVTDLADSVDGAPSAASDGTGGIGRLERIVVEFQHDDRSKGQARNDSGERVISREQAVPCVSNDSAPLNVLMAAKEAPGTSDEQPIFASAVETAGERRFGLAALRAGVAGQDALAGFWPLGIANDGAFVWQPSLTNSGEHVLVLSRPQRGAAKELHIFRSSSVQDGPIYSTPVGEDSLETCVGTIWCEDTFTWAEHGNKPAKSAYEVFEDKNWNDIESSFSSFGFNQLQ